ncbi:MAG: hypothetical protein ACX93P_01320 [Roseovarius sp.]
MNDGNSGQAGGAGPNDAGGIRDGIEERLTDERLQSLHVLTGAQSTPEVFRIRLITILARYERYLITFTKTPKKERRSQLEKLEKNARALSETLATTSQDVLRLLDAHGDDFEATEWDDWSFDSGKPLPLKDPLSERVQTTVSELLDATRAELADVNRVKNEPRQVKQVALIQLIEDLAGLYASETEAVDGGGRARVAGGGRQGFVKAVLDWYDPGGYFSGEALKQRIKRTLRSD